MAVCIRICNKILDAVTGVSSDAFYIAAFMAYLFTTVVNSTMFTVPNPVYKLCFAVMLLGLFIHIILYVRYTAAELAAALIFAAVAMLLYLKAGYMDPMIWVMFMFGAKNVSMRRILAAYVLTAGGLVLTAFLGAFTGAIVNLRFDVEEEGYRYIRNAFGMVYTTDCAAHIFYLMAACFYLFRGRIRTAHYILCLLAALFFWIFCRTRDDCLSMLLLIIGFYLLDHRRPSAYSPGERYKGSVLPRLSALFMPAAAAGIIALTWVYDESVRWMYEFNDLSSNRLRLGNSAIMDYGPKLFGQYIKMVGKGGTVRKRPDYFFLDSSYVNILMRYGTVFFLMTIGVFVMICRKYRRDGYFLICITVIAFNSIMAHHLIELAYNPFSLALFAAAGCAGAEKPCKLPKPLSVPQT